jgi:hypothetical protein
VNAQVIFTLGNHPQPGEENVLLNNGTTGNPVMGLTQMSSIQVCFSSITDTLFEPSNGQARVETSAGAGNGNPNDNPLNDVKVFICNPDGSMGSFTDIIFNPHIGGSDAPPSGPGVVTVNSTFGIQVFNYPGSGLGNGENFLTIVADAGTFINTVTIDATNGFTDLRQIRLSGASTTGGGGRVPEPGALTLLAGGLITCMAALRRRRR